MEFREREGIGFEEAERRHAELQRRHDAGEIDEEEFDAERQRLLVVDDEGRWWAKAREGGRWHYNDGGGAWIEATPPVFHRGNGSEDSPERLEPLERAEYDGGRGAEEARPGQARAAGERHCANCGAPVGSKASFCVSCGEYLAPQAGVYPVSGMAPGQSGQGPTTQRPGGRRRSVLLIGLGVLCAVLAVGLIAALAYSSVTGGDITGEAGLAAEQPESAVEEPEPAAEEPEPVIEESEPETANFALTDTFTGHSDIVEEVAFAPDGSLLASSDVDGAVRLWDPASGDEIQTLDQQPDPVRAVAFSPDGGILASGNDDHTVKLWDPTSGELLQTLEGHLFGIPTVAFSPDGSLLASGSFGATVKLWDPQSGEEIRTLEGHADDVDSVAFSPDGSLLASSGVDETIKLWDPQSGEEIQTLEGHTDWVISVAFSPDGSLLASGGVDDTIKLWDAATGELQRTLAGDSADVYSVAFSPDGSLLASVGEDGTVKLWDPQSGELLQTLEGHSDDVWSVAFSPDGSLIASGSADDTIKTWGRAEG